MGRDRPLAGNGRKFSAFSGHPHRCLVRPGSPTDGHTDMDTRNTGDQRLGRQAAFDQPVRRRRLHDACRVIGGAVLLAGAACALRAPVFPLPVRDRAMIGQPGRKNGSAAADKDHSRRMARSVRAALQTLPRRTMPTPLWICGDQSRPRSALFQLNLRVPSDEGSSPSLHHASVTSASGDVSRIEVGGPYRKASVRLRAKTGSFRSTGLQPRELVDASRRSGVNACGSNLVETLRSDAVPDWERANNRWHGHKHRRSVAQPG